MVGTKMVSAVAAAGSKCFVGNRSFWAKVNRLFETLNKNASVDSIFQRMVGLDELDLVLPLLGATLPHYSMRTGQLFIHHGLAQSDIGGSLLPLPGGYIESLYETAKQ